MKRTKLKAGDLRITVDADGAFGWCGLSRIEHKEYAKQWLLSPAFTLEHYIGIPLDASDYVEYEPCYSAKQLQEVSDEQCTLRYEASPPSKIAFSATYQVVALHYVDVTMQMKTEREDWPLGYIALFFATIVNAPIYSGIYLLGEDTLTEAKIASEWIHFNGLATHPGKTVHPHGIANPELHRPTASPTPYYYSDSSVRFRQPLFYGLVDQMVFALLFRPENREEVRFTVNPVAPAFGGPAWDFFWVIAEPKAGELYSLSFRSIFKPFAGADDIQQEYQAFLAS